jgi:protein-L-isoaspartate(D-aspartate) O-methyltransferase
MVEQQIRTWDVLDQRVLDLLFVVRREEFVPPAHRALAFADLELPLGDKQAMWTPKMEARVVQELRIKPGESVLEIGTGSGYLAALLARIGGRVTSVELSPRLAAFGRANLRNNAIAGVDVVQGDGARGFGSDTYDAIVLTGSTPILPDDWLRQLNPGGRIFAVVGEPPVMTARLVTWVGPTARTTENLFETLIAPLVNAPAPARFEF